MLLAGDCVGLRVRVSGQGAPGLETRLDWRTLHEPVEQSLVERRVVIDPAADAVPHVGHAPLERQSALLRVGVALHLPLVVALALRDLLVEPFLLADEQRLLVGGGREVLLVVPVLVEQHQPRLADLLRRVSVREVQEAHREHRYQGSSVLLLHGADLVARQEHEGSEFALLRFEVQHQLAGEDALVEHRVDLGARVRLDETLEPQPQRDVLRAAWRQATPVVRHREPERVQRRRFGQRTDDRHRRLRQRGPGLEGLEASGLLGHLRLVLHARRVFRLLLLVLPPVGVLVAARDRDRADDHDPDDADVPVVDTPIPGIHELFRETAFLHDNSAMWRHHPHIYFSFCQWS